MAADDNTATFALELETDDAEAGSERAAGALEKLRAKLQDDVGALRAMQQAMRNLKGGTSTNIEAFRNLRDQITAQKASIASAQERYLHLGGSMKDMAKKAEEGGVGLKGLVDAARSGGGPLGGMLSRASGLKDMLGTAGLAGVAIASAAAVVALTVALVAGVVALTSFGLAQANAARAERLTLEGLVRIPNYYGMAADKASYLQESINAVSATSALGRDKIAGYATELYRMGLRGQNLKDSLDATAIASSAAGDSYGAMVKGQLAGTAFVGGSVKKLADTIKARFGGVARAQMLDLNVQSAKLKEGITQIFAGVKIEGFLSALNEVTQLFSQNTFTGKALKVLVETLLNPLIAGIEKTGPLAKRFFQGMVITALQFAIVVLQVRNQLRETFGRPSLFKGIDWMNAALVTGEAAGGALVAVLLGLAAVLAIIAVGTVIAFSPLILVFAVAALAVYAVATAIDWLGDKFAAAYEFVAKLDWGQLAKDLIDGLVNGITSGVGRVVDAVKGLGRGALKAFGVSIDAHSPSRAFARFGLFMPQGVVQGVEQGTPGVHQAVDAMVSIPAERPQMTAGGATDAAGAPGRPGPGAGAGVHVEIHAVNYTGSGKDSHPSHAQDFATQLRQSLEGVLIHLGAPA